MACKYIAPNGKKSELYDKVYTNFGYETAHATYARVNSKEFKDNYDGKLDDNGEPVLEESQFIQYSTGKQEQIPIQKTDNPINLESAASQIEQLTSLFEQQGLDIEVTMDGDIVDAGQVITVAGKTKVSFNPRQLRKDTVFHEFGHIYVDMLGNDRVVQRGIENLRGSELWNKVVKVYPELSDAELGKEVLTTAIGIESAKLYDERVKIRESKKGGLLSKIQGWAAWFNNFVGMIADKLGISNNIAKRLAYDLTGGKFRYTLTGKPSTKLQKQKVTINDLISKSKGVKLSADEMFYISPETGVALKRVTTALDDIKGEFNRDEVIQNILRSNKPEWKHFTNEEDLMMFWADKREEGTGIHNIADYYIKERNKGTSIKEAKKVALDNLHKPQAIGTLDEDGVRFYSGMDTKKVEGYIDNISDFIESLYKKGYKLYTEIKIYDDDMGLAGTIDLLILKPNGKYMIYDWKTKERGKFDNFYAEENKGYLGLMSNVKRSKANDYSLQLSTYKLMLERQGFEFDEKDSLAIIPLVGIAETIKSETRYRDVGLANNVQGQNSDGVLPLADLSKNLQDVYQVKTDIEKFIEQAEQADGEIENFAEQISHIAHTKDWLKNLLVNLEKSVSRIRAQGSAEAGERYERGVKELIKKIAVADENMAIAAYTDYVARSLSSIYAKFADGYKTIVNEDGSTTRRPVKGFSSWTWQDIKNLEETNPKEYVDFLAFMINAQMFMEQIVQIRKLPETVGKEMNIVFAALKQYEGKVSDIQLKLDRLDKELDHRYAELSSNPLYGGRGVLQATEDFFKAQIDESFFQRNMDAMADTHNKYIANVMRMYDYKQRVAFDDQNARLKEWRKQVAKLKEAGSSVDKFVDKTTGKVIPKMDYDAYVKSRAEMYLAASKFTAGTKQWRNIVNTWYGENVELIPAKDRDAIVAEKKKELTPEQFDVWLNKNSYVGKKGRHWAKKGVMYRPKADKYTNPVYASYSKEEVNFWKYLNATLAELTDHTKSSVVKAGYIPAVPKNQKTFMEQFLSNIGYRDKGVYDAEKGVIVNELGEVVYFLPFMYNNLLHQKPLELIDPSLSIEKQREISERNKIIQQENRDAHAASIEQDLELTMPIFIRTAITHKHKKVMEFELLRVKRSFERNHKIQVVKNGQPVVDKMKDMKGLENNTVEKTTVGSNVLEHYNDFLKMVFYEEFENDEGTLQKVARVLQNYTSFKSMAINPFSALNNQVYGEIMAGIESAAGQFFNGKDWVWAGKEYTKGIPSFFADDEDTGQFSSKQSAFMHHIPIIMDFKELALNDNVNGSLGNVALQKMGNAVSKAYLLEHFSEHNIQNRILLALAQSHKVVDGVIMSFDEYVRGKLETITKQEINDNIEEAQAIVARNKEKRKELQKEWETFTSLYDSFDFIDGELKLKEGVKLSKNEVAEFQRKALGVGQYLFGIYNKKDAGTMQQYALGRLAIQFRKWMRPGWNKRWGTQFGKSFWNERRSMQDEGMYVTTFNFFTAPLMDGIKHYRESEEMTLMKAIGNITKDYGRFVTNIKLHWHTLTDTQKANVIRTIGEYLTFSMAIGAVILLKHMKGEDEDPPLALMLALYQADRTATELTTYVPLAVAPGFIGGGWLNESKKLLKSPTATFNTMEAAIRIGKELLAYPFAQEEDLVYKGGVYHGENKLEVMTQKMIPLWNQYHKFTNLTNNYKFYKLF